jgi:metal-responsive CopG/Arc/MetJ family transcriptional regulator
MSTAITQTISPRTNWDSVTSFILDSIISSFHVHVTNNLCLEALALRDTAFRLE